MGLLDALKDIAFVPVQGSKDTADSQSPSAPAEGPPSAPPAHGAPIVISSNPAPSTPSTPYSAPTYQNVPTPSLTDPATKERLFNILSKSSYKTYINFLETASRLRKFINAGDEKVYAAALETSPGLSPNDLKMAVNDGLRVLKDFKVKAEESYNQELSDRVGRRQQEIASVQAAAEDKRNQIAALQVEVNQLNERETELNQEMIGEQSDIDAAKRRVDTTHAAMTSELEQELRKIDRIIPAKAEGEK